ncbi:MAG: ATP-binding protein [Crocinitomicaceae bacterium]
MKYYNIFQGAPKSLKGGNPILVVNENQLFDLIEIYKNGHGSYDLPGRKVHVAGATFLIYELNDTYGTSSDELRSNYQKLLTAFKPNKLTPQFFLQGAKDVTDKMFEAFENRNTRSRKVDDEIKWDDYTHEELMQMTIDVMNKSINEPRPDGKIPPKVGALILFPDGRIETAHRGELREGDHAEYTLMERKLTDVNLEGCVLYTTLEPCVERNDPKVPCCRRTTNARIKKVYVGIEDPDPTVDGKGINHLIKHQVEVKMFNRKFQKEIQKENEAFLKQAISRKEDKKDDVIVYSDLELMIPSYPVSKFSTKALNKFIREANLGFTSVENDFWFYLEDIGAVQFNEKLKKFCATGYGVILFGESPGTKFPNTVIKAQIKYGRSKIEPQDFNEPLVMLPDAINNWLLKVLPLDKDTSTFKREDKTDYPTPVLREAIINALLHRDYLNKSAKINLILDDDLIQIKSPGGPHPAISIEELNSFAAPSLSNNPILSHVFSLMDYSEEKGFGMETFKSIKREYNLALPKFEYKKPFLTLNFPRTQEGYKQVIDKDPLEELTSKELDYIDFFRGEKILSKSEFSELTGLTDRTAERMLKKFVEINLIKKEGGGRSTKYVFNE